MTDGFVDRTLVAPIRLDDAQGAWQFDPLPDITPYEVALITQLFTAMVLRRTRLDWREYLVRAHAMSAGDGIIVTADLSRHFSKEF